MQVTKKTVVRPNQRYQMITDIVEQRRFNEDKYLKEIGMTVQDEEMLIVNGRLIAPPEVKYISGRDGQTEVVERISIGKFVALIEFHTPTVEPWFIADGIFVIAFKRLAISRRGPA